MLCRDDCVALRSVVAVVACRSWNGLMLARELVTKPVEGHLILGIERGALQKNSSLVSLGAA
jgi:hypothetical protein